MNTRVVHNKIIWTDDHISFLKDRFYTLTNKQLADKLKLKITSVRTKCYSLGLKRMDLEYWTEEQIYFLKANYKAIGDTELAMMFSAKWYKQKGWSKKHIEKKRRYLKLGRNKAQIKAIHLRNVENGCFALCPVKAWEKRGITPLYTVKKWQKITVIKTPDGYVHYAPYLWIKHYGLIPNGMIVRRKMEAKEISIENLELITRAENARRNNDYPTELKQTIRLLNKLKKQINGKEQN